MENKPSISKIWQQPGFPELFHVRFSNGTRGIAVRLESGEVGPILIKALGHAFFVRSRESLTKKLTVVSLWTPDRQYTIEAGIVDKKYVVYRRVKRVTYEPWQIPDRIKN